ncbi:MAG TPA: glutamate--tRNA ligase family protein, partial [Bacillota bacterium]|nr:glutamate--tRNA ligase family protein [Bacillota bacterium]
LVNFLALLGWNPGTDQEIFSMDELVDAFSVETLSRSDAVFDIKKLDWFNGVYIRSLTPEDLAARVRPFMEQAGYAIPDREFLKRAVTLVTDRLGKLTEAPDMLGFLFTDQVDLTRESFAGKGKLTLGDIAGALRECERVLGELSQWTHEDIEASLRTLAESLGWKVGDLLMQVRVAITGRRVTPPLFESLVLLGRETSMARIARAIRALEE